jgi:hypothetical protein
MIKVTVFSSGVEIDVDVFFDEKKALAYADEKQDQGFKVRISAV